MGSPRIATIWRSMKFTAKIAVRIATVDRGGPRGFRHCGKPDEDRSGKSLAQVDEPATSGGAPGAA